MAKDAAQMLQDSKFIMRACVILVRAIAPAYLLKSFVARHRTVELYIFIIVCATPKV